MLEISRELIHDGIARGHHVGAQVYVSLKGEAVIDEAIGLARVGESGGPDGERSLERDDLALWLSATKPVAAIAIAQLWERGKLDLDAPIADTIPEFDVNGKAPITTRHVLTHTGGFREADLAFIEPDWDEAVRKVCEAPLEKDWVIGETAGYHDRSGWYVLGEIVRRIDGRHFRDYVRAEIFGPLGMDDCWVGMPPERYRAYGDRITPTYITERGAMTDADMAAEEACVPCVPGGNGRGPMRQLGRFYEALLNGGELDGTRILKFESVAEFTRTHRADTYDETFRHKMDWGLGFIMDSKHHGKQTVPYGYGDHASARTFGHGGRQSVASFADPEHGLVCCVQFNGMPGEPRHNQRARKFATALYEDLGLG